MDQVHVIRHKVLVEGQSVRSVGRQLGVSRNTVRKYLRVSAPVRVERQPRPRPVFERVRSRIEALVDEWRPRTTAKQRITGSRLHRQLVEEGLQVGVTTVRAYLRELRRRSAEVYVPLVHRPGEGQVDFFEVTVDVGGERRKVWKFLLRLMYSGRDFAGPSGLSAATAVGSGARRSRAFCPRRAARLSIARRSCGMLFCR